MFSFFDRLMVSLSRRSGDRRWGLLSVFCAALILGWVVMALPWIDAITGSHLGAGSFGRGIEPTLNVYGWVLGEEVADRYSIAVFIGAVFCGLVVRIFDIGMLLANGYTYRVVRPGRFFSGIWSRD